MSDIKITAGIIIATLALALSIHEFNTQNVASGAYDSRAFRLGVYHVFSCIEGDWTIGNTSYTVRKADEPYCEINGMFVPLDIRQELKRKFLDYDIDMRQGKTVIQPEVSLNET
jgi:hypothetical protein